MTDKYDDPGEAKENLLFIIKLIPRSKAIDALGPANQIGVYLDRQIAKEKTVVVEGNKDK